SRGNPWVYSAWLPADGASMEPRLLSRGNAEDRRPRPGSDHCFNGATASQPWKRAPFTTLTPLHSRLQWSHGFSAVETAWYGTRTGVDVERQWSHGLAAVETGLEPAGRPRGQPSFNGATASQPWKPHELRPGAGHDADALSGDIEN